MPIVRLVYLRDGLFLEGRLRFFAVRQRYCTDRIPAEKAVGKAVEKGILNCYGNELLLKVISILPIMYPILYQLFQRARASGFMVSPVSSDVAFYAALPQVFPYAPNQ